jgi:hypothetical protein
MQPLEEQMELATPDVGLLCFRKPHRNRVMYRKLNAHDVGNMTLEKLSANSCVRLRLLEDSAP